jgi:hypothetical protein
MQALSEPRAASAKSQGSAGQENPPAASPRSGRQASQNRHNVPPQTTGESMAEDIQQDASQPGVQVLLDERELRQIYSNSYRIHATNDEVIIDLGFNMPNPNPQSSQQQLLLKITDRVVMSYMNAKRLSQSLGQLIKRYEQQFGELVPANQRVQNR